MSRAPATSAALEGKRLSFVGWGATASDESGSGTKRLAVLPVVDSDADYLYSIEEGGPNLCFGDSGGPASVRPLRRELRHRKREVLTDSAPARVEPRDPDQVLAARRRVERALARS